MRSNWFGCNVLAVSVVLLGLGPFAHGAEPPKRLCEAAKPLQRPAGAPKASDVIMRTLSWHPRNAKDPHDTMQALEDFHVSRLEWAYVDKKPLIEKVKASRRVFGGAASAPSYVPVDRDSDWFEKVVILNLDGEPIIAPWKRTWNRTLWGCINNPELERGYMQYLQRYVDAGADVMQRDEPGANLNATRWGGCFCPHCIKAFRRYLAENTSPEKRKELGITDLETFDYREHLRREGAPVGDPFGRWDGGELKRLFVAFQTEATIAFHRRTRKALDAYAGRRVPMSCNNGAHRWSEIELMFDWAFGELSYGRSRPDVLYTAMREAAEHDRIQVVTMPKKGDYDNPDEWQRRTRQTIATAYACGGLCMVAWDVYMPRDAPRYFGTPEQYADLFGFIRANAAYLDGYEDAAVVGKGMKNDRYGPSPPVAVRGGSGDVWAFVRARPGEPEAPVAIHLIEWGSESKPFALALKNAGFFGPKPLSLQLFVPSQYDRAAHQKAEQTGDFSPLAKAVELKAEMQGGLTTVEVPALNPWGILVVSPKQ
jgi:hypothetical protein